MKFNNSIVLAALCTLVASCPVDTSKRDVDPALIPSLGFKSGVNPTGTGDCDGAVKDASGKPIKIPCACPPDQATFNKALSANVAAGHAINNPSVGVSFPTDGSVNSQITRVQAALVTLQNLNGPGKGCPAVSTTLSAQLSALQNGGGKPPATPPAAAPKRDVDPALVPPLGFTAGVNPTGTGDCDGAVKGADGKPIKIPCSCPPSQASFNQALSANVAAGHAVNNPSVAVSFPTDGSVNSQITRVQAALVTLQNLNGPGKGCPAVSTTLSAQLSALQNGGAPPAPATPPPAPAPAPPAPAPAPAAPAQGTPPPADAASLSTAQLDALTPQFGFASNVNPTGTGDCDGAVNGADGKPIKVPCACPPPRDQFLADLAANIKAGKATNNPSVAVTFPTDSSPNSQRARITAAIITLQNLNGPGKGCPSVSTTFTAQANAIKG